MNGDRKIFWIGIDGSPFSDLFSRSLNRLISALTLIWIKYIFFKYSSVCKKQKTTATCQINNSDQNKYTPSFLFFFYQFILALFFFLTVDVMVFLFISLAVQPITQVHQMTDQSSKFVFHTPILLVVCMESNHFNSWLLSGQTDCWLSPILIFSLFGIGIGL